MELIEGIESRRSIRGFKTTAIPKETLVSILRAAGKSPSYKNTQPWEIVVLSGKKKEELAKTLLKLAKSGAVPNQDFPHPANLPPDLDNRAREHGMRRLQALEIQREDHKSRQQFDLTNYDFYGAPCGLLLFLNGTSTAYSIFDMGMFTQNILLAAHSFGLGGCFQAMLANYPDTIREFLGFPETKKLLGGVALGYPDTTAKVNKYIAKKVNMDDFVHWNTE